MSRSFTVGDGLKLIGDEHPELPAISGFNRISSLAHTHIFFHLFQVAGLKNFQLELEKDVKVRDVKKMAQEECNIEPEHMRLIYNSRQLKDWDTLESYKGHREAACAIWDG